MRTISFQSALARGSKLGLVCLATAYLAACAQFGASFQSATASLSSGINSVSAALSSPQTTQAVANLRAGAQAVICAVGSVSQLSVTLGQDVKDQLLVRDANTVYAISSALCTKLGGSPLGTAVVPASASSL